MKTIRFEVSIRFVDEQEGDFTNDKINEVATNIKSALIKQRDESGLSPDDAYAITGGIFVQPFIDELS